LESKRVTKVALLGLITVKLICAQPAFLFPITVPMGGNISSLIAGDFNNDARGDLAVSFGTSGAAVLLGNPDGTVTRVDLSIPPAASPATFIAVADFNGDHKPDLLGRVGSGLNYFVMLGNGDGTFEAPVLFQAAGMVLAVADFNLDGFADILVEYQEVDVMSSRGVLTGFAVQLGRGDGSFLDIGPHYFSNFIAYGVGVGDLNGDGLPDVVWPAAQIPNVWLGNGDGSFHPVGVTGTDSDFPLFYPATVIGDINGDGKNDVLIQQGSSVQIYLGDGAGNLSSGGEFLGPCSPSMRAGNPDVLKLERLCSQAAAPDLGKGARNTMSYRRMI
jgi:hypothetical protein